MAEDRLKKDYDTVENLGDLIEAREERDSAFADDVDAMEDIDLKHLPFDAEEELGRPHRHMPSEDERLGIDVELMGAPKESEVEFDWQDSAEEMLPTDPAADEGMGADGAMELLAHIEPTDLTGPVPSTEPSPETDTAATEREKEEYDLDGGEEAPCPPPKPIELESAMETDSDEFDFAIEDRFADQVDHMAAEAELEEMRKIIEEEGRK